MERWTITFLKTVADFITVTEMSIYIALKKNRIIKLSEITHYNILVHVWQPIGSNKFIFFSFIINGYSNLATVQVSLFPSLPNSHNRVYPTHYSHPFCFIYYLTLNLQTCNITSKSYLCLPAIPQFRWEANGCNYQSYINTLRSFCLQAKELYI